MKQVLTAGISEVKGIIVIGFIVVFGILILGATETAIGDPLGILKNAQAGLLTLPLFYLALPSGILIAVIVWFAGQGNRTG